MCKPNNSTNPICGNCGNEVTRKDYKRDVGNTYCNRECYLAVHKSKPKFCANCGLEFKARSLKRKYCSHECRVQDKKPIATNCSHCGVLFSAVKQISGRARWYVRVTNAKTCSKECLSEFYRTNKARKEKISKAFRAEKHPNWQGGSHRGDKRGPGWRRIAERCRDLHGRKCKHCGMTEEESKAKGWGRLQVNHIVPFHQCRNKQRANKQSNLEALCKSCHTKADWKWRKENPVQQSLNIFR